MRILLELRKGDAVIYRGIHDISDAESFGRAMSQVWVSVNEAKLARASNVGQVMEFAGEEIVDEIGGATLILSRQR